MLGEILFDAVKHRFGGVDLGRNDDEGVDVAVGPGDRPIGQKLPSLEVVDRHHPACTWWDRLLEPAIVRGDYLDAGIRRRLHLWCEHLWVGAAEQVDQIVPVVKR